MSADQKRTPYEVLRSRGSHLSALPSGNSGRIVAPLLQADLPVSDEIESIEMNLRLQKLHAEAEVLLAEREVAKARLLRNPGAGAGFPDFQRTLDEFRGLLSKVQYTSRRAQEARSKWLQQEHNLIDCGQGILTMMKDARPELDDYLIDVLFRLPEVQESFRESLLGQLPSLAQNES
jgi:hypothetical protein